VGRAGTGWLWAASIAAIVAGGACSKSSADACADTVATPGGFIPRECVHEVPNGAEISNDDAGVATVRVNGKVVAMYPPCPCHVTLDIGGGRPPQSDSGQDATADGSSDAWDAGTDYTPADSGGDGPIYCSAHGPLTSKAEAADAGESKPCPGMCIPFAGGGGGSLPDGAPVPQPPAGWACVIETGCANSGGDAGTQCAPTGSADR
jgi:hypothetical protein